MDWGAAPLAKQGRQQAYSDAAIQACLTIKVLFDLPLRQATGFVESLLQLLGLNWSVPEFGTLCRRQKDVVRCYCISRISSTATPSDRQYWHQSGG